MSVSQVTWSLEVRSILSGSIQSGASTCGGSQHPADFTPNWWPWGWRTLTNHVPGCHHPSPHSPAASSVSTSTCLLAKRRAPSTTSLRPRRDPAAEPGAPLASSPLSPPPPANPPSLRPSTSSPPGPRTRVQQNATRSSQRHLVSRQGWRATGSEAASPALQTPPPRAAPPTRPEAAGAQQPREDWARPPGAVTWFLVRSPRPRDPRPPAAGSTSNWKLLLSENHSMVKVCSPYEVDTKLLSLIHLPVKESRDYYSLADIVANGHSLDGRIINVLAAVRSVGEPKHFTTSDGRKGQRCEVKLFDETEPSFTVTW
ncbi:hypothetical protein NN561_018524 [Cricetulus griseus]